MADIEALISRIDDDKDMDRLRKDIANAIGEGLAEAKAQFGYWEKAHYAQAIAALAWNINIGDRDARSWLRLCLVNLELAQVAPDNRSEDYVPRNVQIDKLSFEGLAADVRKCGGEL